MNGKPTDSTSNSPDPASQLTFQDHNRDVMGLTHVYPVVSRRAGGVSVGINLNTNNACNWACVYCQVPQLKRGNAPDIQTDVLKDELSFMLKALLQGDFLQKHVPEPLRKFQDIAFSGNGEPTSSPQFEAAVQVVVEALRVHQLTGKIKLVLITNGSHALEPAVQRALILMSQANGEVWFKLDRGRAEDLWRINRIHLDPALVLRRLSAAAAHCPTWVQTCMTTWDGHPPSDAEVQAYLDLLTTALEQGIPLRGVLLYSLARPSFQPDAPRVGPLPLEWLEALGLRIAQMGLPVRITP